jgi:hypothetical protein
MVWIENAVFVSHVVEGQSQVETSQHGLSSKVNMPNLARNKVNMPCHSSLNN